MPELGESKHFILETIFQITFNFLRYSNSHSNTMLQTLHKSIWASWLLLCNRSTFCQAAQTSPETWLTNSQILDNRLENRGKNRWSHWLQRHKLSSNLPFCIVMQYSYTLFWCCCAVVFRITKPNISGQLQVKNYCRKTQNMY